MKTENRFTGSLSDEYHLVTLMIPHYEEHEDTLRQAIASHVSGLKQASFTAIDLGCGSGFSTRRILDADSRINVVAVDNEPAMLRQAEKYLKDDASRIEFTICDAGRLLQITADRSVDIVASGCLLHNLPPEYRLDVMEEVARVLRPGGLFVNADKYGSDDRTEHARALEEQFQNLYAFDEIGRADLRHAWHAHYVEDEKIDFSEAEQVGLFARFGFTSVQRIYRKRLEATYVAIKE